MLHFYPPNPDKPELTIEDGENISILLTR